MGLIREHTNALLDIARIAQYVAQQVTDGNALDQVLLDSLVSALRRKSRAETQYQIIRLVTDPITLIPFRRDLGMGM